MFRIEDAAVDDIILGDEQENVVKQHHLRRFLLLNRFEVFAEAPFAERPMRDGKAVLLAVGFEFRFPPVAIQGGIAFQVEGFLGGFAVARIEHELGHPSRVPHHFGLIGRHIVGHAVLRLAGGVSLEKGGAAVFKAIQHRFVKFHGVGHGHLCHERGAMARGERFGHIFLFDQLALRRDSELVHVVTAEHG